MAQTRERIRPTRRVILILRQAFFRARLRTTLPQNMATTISFSVRNSFDLIKLRPLLSLKQKLVVWFFETFFESGLFRYLTQINLQIENQIKSSGIFLQRSLLFNTIINRVLLFLVQLTYHVFDGVELSFSCHTFWVWIAIQLKFHMGMKFLLTLLIFEIRNIGWFWQIFKVWVGEDRLKQRFYASPKFLVRKIVTTDFTYETNIFYEYISFDVFLIESLHSQVFERQVQFRKWELRSRKSRNI